ncbi:hypothetical protein AN639_01700 [Candidatus Epulonipiscium fishelsonii]|uniref:Uncharacterized protein n=1 Tax=Candidatus Epulonipiscium fishelsonii TaxID=77094 RepID=A0ACC8XE33_9FIRM|nr:hypothetical protein AN639_01700 [Epulopiscium sp. SCG-B05WGA-EpuloA1]ONI41218.1 hypothetical protein AN396_03780 [Epulopiscium sp. SCG-B11WGA-EpuloA1]
MLVIKDAKIYTSANKIYEKGTIVIENGKITQVGEEVTISENAKVIDAKGLVVTAGIIDAHSHIGGFGRTMEEQDLNEMTNHSTPEIESYYGIDFTSPMFTRAYTAGITTSALAPGSGNVVGGLVCAVKSYGKNMDDMCIENPIALKMALGGNPKGVYGKRNQMPMTRMGIAQVIRENFLKAQEYMKKQEQAKDDNTKKPPYNQGLENVARVLRREIPIKVHCEQFDMLTTLKIAEEFNVKFTLDHAWGSSDFYDEISSAKNLVGVIFGPAGVYLTPGECGKVDIECLIELNKRGVLCSIMTDGPILNPDVIIQQAGELVRFGASEEIAINMLTINPAKIIGQSHRIGSIEVGKDADIVIFKGIPTLDTNAKVVTTIINGEVVYQ